MMRKYLSTILVTCMITSTVLCGCSTDVMPPTNDTEIVPADDTKQTISTEKEADNSNGATSKKIDRILTDLPTSWDLTDIYVDYDAFEADMDRTGKLLDEVGGFRGTLGSAEGIRNYLESPINLDIDASMKKAEMYSELLELLNATDPKAQKAKARFKELEQKKKIARAFYDTEIMEIPFEERQKILSDEQLAPYTYYLRKFTDENYQIPGEEAQKAEALMEPAVNSQTTYSIFENVELIRPSFTYPDGTESVLTNAEYSRIIENPDYDRDFRNEVYELRNSMRMPYSNTYASLLEGEMRKNIAMAKLRGFDTALDYALFENDVDPEVYRRIIEFAHSIIPAFNDYYKARAQFIGVDKLIIPDLYIPDTDYNPGEITYEDAVNLGRSAISVWGDEYLKTFDKIITKPHIDVYPADAKTSGAYEYLLGNETTPYVMYNFNGMTAYTSPIVHEMGHAVYSEFSAENQNTYTGIPSIFTQEVTSTANEIMLHKKMIDNASTNDEKLYWLGSEIDLFMGTLSAQCRYSEFEDYCYKVLESGGSLNGDDLNKKWLELTRLYYGDYVEASENSGIGWTGIPHFYYNYYVYQYATSITYAASICNLVDKNGQNEVDDYISFLKAGACASPADLLRIANVDPLDDKTYEEAAALINELIEEYVSAINEKQ